VSVELKSLVTAADNFVSQSRWREAAETYARLAVLCPRQPGIHHVRGLVLMEDSRWEAAVEAIDQAISLCPDNAAFYRSRGDALLSAGNPQQAVQSFLTALDLMPADINTMINLGNALHTQGLFRQAIQWYQNALSLSPGNIIAMNNIGKSLHDIGHIEQALLWYEKALCIDATYGEARFNRSVALLAQGDFSRGWAEYEWRFRRKTAFKVYPHKLQKERWNGSPYAGKRLLVHCEQGMGDVIQFCRYLPQVKALGGTLIVEAHAPLIPLLRTMSCIDEVVPFSVQCYPQVVFDLYIPLLSLPALFGTSLNNIPGPTPYLHADAQKALLWRSNTEKPASLRVGLVWSGSTVDPQRACPIEHLSSLFAIKDVHFFSLQIDPSEQSLNVLSDSANVTHWGNRLRDFSDTAAAMTSLDIVISVDTAAAHLAGAMGIPVWILLPAVPDWRWLINRDDSPWYPSARLFRCKNTGNWPGLIRILHNELERLAAIHRAFNNGCANHHAGRLDDAISAYAQTISLAPDLEAAHRNLALSYFQKGELQQAAGCYERSLQLRPDSPDVLSNLSAVYQQLQQTGQAQNCCLRALAVDPQHVAARYNLGNICLDQGNLDAAADQYRQTLNIDPTHISSLCNLGRALHRLGQIDASLDVYNRALKISPEHPEVRFNRAIALLLQGKWSDGWPDYEYRFRCHNRMQIYPHQISGCRWQGQSFDGKTLLVHGEQGFGDALQFVRFLPMVKQLGGRVVLETHGSLLSLFKCLEEVDAMIELSAQHPPRIDFDLYIPLCSLPGIFNTTPNNLPDCGPYLFARKDRIKQWSARLPPKGPNVGLVWSGSNTYPERSCNLQDLAHLLKIENINWIGLQKGHGTAQIEVPRLPSGLPMTNWGPEFADFSDTAAAIASLDLIISIDTCVAHLAGAMGKPVWLLLPKVPDWRWLLRSSHTPWYASMRLFRQAQAGDWQPVMQAMASKLGDAGFR
jgi:tetratricopeptide (TPR) repeat protein